MVVHILLNTSAESLVLIGECMRDIVLDSVRQSHYLAVLIDGSTDSSVVEKELVYVMCVGPEGKAQCCFFLQLKDVLDATAPGILKLLVETFATFGIDLMKKLVRICVDGAAVNLGVRHGLAALIKKDVPWLVAIHCMNHRLELSAKDAFSNTFLNEVSTMLVNLHFVYENSPKRLRELRNVAEIMEERIRKPERATGTRWGQHKSRAIKSLLMGYDVIVTHLESMASGESSVKPVDKIKFKGYLTKFTSYKCVLYMLFFDALLDPLASFSCSIHNKNLQLIYLWQ